MGAEEIFNADDDDWRGIGLGLIEICIVLGCSLGDLCRRIVNCCNTKYRPAKQSSTSLARPVALNENARTLSPQAPDTLPHLPRPPGWRNHARRAVGLALIVSGA